jgi:non-specific serine/threonine protein kinase/serine/threonine-protein kinase
MSTGGPEELAGLEDTASMPPDSKPTPNETSHRRIGPYRLLHAIGEGGMGEVWVADQLEPVKRRVALKVIKAGMDTKQVVARFEAERQALAVMDHPAIAKVLDAGATPEGRPYFVMEYVPGVSITDHCDTHRLSMGERLRLFIEVCEGVQHAHQKAIIHRDLKPSNILVSLVDGRAQPKIIDFGIAKAIGHRLTERTLFTEAGTVIGTPEYMSPEQADLTGQDVDTRTDVYSLGVILYELLTGALPFASGELRASSYEELRRKLREVEPPKPSTKAATLGEGGVEAARRRDTDPGSLRRQLKGDLDAITMKALEKDRVRRYGTPSEFSADVGRFLRQEPVQARPASRLYRLSKYVRKHRVGVTVATTLLVLLIAFTASTWNQAQRIAEERDRANDESWRASRLARRKAQELDFFTDMFRPSAEAIASGKRITALELLDNAARKVSGLTTEDPVLRDELRGALATSYVKMGLNTQSGMLLSLPDRRLNLEGKRRGRGDDHIETLVAEVILARALVSIGNLGEAEALFRDVVRRRAHAVDVDRIDVGARQMLARILTQRGQYLEAERLLREALPLAERKDPALPLGASWLMLELAIVLAHEGQMAEAESLRRRALGLAAEVTEPGGAALASVEYGSACVLAIEGKRGDALNALASALEHGLSAEAAVGLADDDDLESLQKDPRFTALVAKGRRMGLAPQTEGLLRQ